MSIGAHYDGSLQQNDVREKYWLFGIQDKSKKDQSSHNKSWDLFELKSIVRRKYILLLISILAN